MMWRAACLGIAMAGCAGSMAAAGDAPGPDWGGFHVGLHGGYATGESNWVDDPIFGGSSLGSHDIDGGLIGAQAGHDWQRGPWVFGAEADAAWADIDGSHVDQFVSDLHTNIDALVTLTGRVGRAWNNALFYVKGGGAWGDFEFEDFTGVGLPLNGAADDSRFGWALGAGLEYALPHRWSVKFEYNYLDFGEDTIGFGGGAGGNFVQTIDLHLHLFKAGVNYRF